MDSRKNNIKEYFYLKKISFSLLKFLSGKLNKIHNINEISIIGKYPWVCYCKYFMIVGKLFHF